MPHKFFWIPLTLLTILPAAEKKVEEAPLTLPGAETFVYRDLAPAPLRLHVFKPVGQKPGELRVGFISFFGGGWTKGVPAVGFSSWATRQGMVAVAADYRTKNRYGTSPLESVADGRAAFRFVQDHARDWGIDPKKIVVHGGSAGGHVALWTAIAPTPPGSSPDEAPLSRPWALILVSPVSDTSKETGYTPTRFGEHHQDLSPVHQIDSVMPPILLIHGDADKTVSYASAVAFDAKLTALKSPHQFITVPGGGHGVPEYKEQIQGTFTSFLKEFHLLPE